MSSDKAKIVEGGNIDTGLGEYTEEQIRQISEWNRNNPYKLTNDIADMYKTLNDNNELKNQTVNIDSKPIIEQMMEARANHIALKKHLGITLWQRIKEKWRTLFDRGA